MIFVRNSPNSAGVWIFGDNQDFASLYEALHTVVGEEDEFAAYQAARLNVLGVCYDLRHALMGGREIEFIDNGMSKDIQRFVSVITPEKNAYFRIEALWPEILFVMMALNNFVVLYAEKRASDRYSPLTDKKDIWDDSIAQVRLFQAAVAKCIKETVSSAMYSRIMSSLNGSYLTVSNYYTQYVDLLNLKFMDMDSEKRLKQLSIMAKRLAERGEEYQALRREIMADAKDYGCPPDEVRLTLEWPDEIDW